MTTEQLVAALAPPFALLLVLNLRGRPWWTVLAAAAAGAACAEVAGLLEGLLTHRPWSIDSMGMLVLFTTVVAGMVEELCKLGALRCGPARWIREEYDGVLYAAAVSLGFAALENVGYVREGGMEAAYARSCTAIPLHAACGVIMGSYLGRQQVRQAHGWSGRGLAATGLAWAIAVHGAYDAIAFTSTPWSGGALYVLTAAAVVWAFRLAQAARSRSAAFGGRLGGLPPATTETRVAPTPPLPVRDERVAAVLGLVPGLGQAYNGELRKAAGFALVFALNIALYAALAAFVHGPVEVLAQMGRWGMMLGVGPQDAGTLVAEGERLQTMMLGVIGVWSVYSGLEAWLTARRAARLDGVAVSYLVHVALLLMLVIAPILAGGGSAGADTNKKGEGSESSSYQITWVDDPKTIDGWNPGSEGGGDGKGDNGPEKRITQEGDGGQDSVTERGAETTQKTADPASGDVGVADPHEKASQKKVGAKPSDETMHRSGDPSHASEGAVKSYNDYISSRLHGGAQEVYFSEVPENVWTVVHYRIDGSGGLSELRVVDTNGTDAEAQRAVTAVRSLIPLAPLPADENGNRPQAIVVTELFWHASGEVFPAGSLPSTLSQLPDGRRIEVEP